MKNTRMSGLALVVCLTTLITACGGIFDPANKDVGLNDTALKPGMGLLRIEIPSVSARFAAALASTLGNVARTVRPRAFLFASRAEFELRDSRGVLVDTWTSTANFELEPNSTTDSSRVVAVGSGYSLNARVFNNKVSTTLPVVTGVVSGISITEGGETAITMPCIPNTTLFQDTLVPGTAMTGGLSSAPYDGTDLTDTGGEAWYRITPTTGTNFVRIAATNPNGAGYYAYICLFEEDGTYTGTSVISGSGASAELLAPVSAGSNYYVGLAYTHTSATVPAPLEVAYSVSLAEESGPDGFAGTWYASTTLKIVVSESVFYRYDGDDILQEQYDIVFFDNNDRYTILHCTFGSMQGKYLKLFWFGENPVTAIGRSTQYHDTFQEAMDDTGTVINFPVYENPANCPPAPSDLTYDNLFSNYVLGTEIIQNEPTVTGVVTWYAVEPPLPAGLDLNIVTGFITGTPTVTSALSGYVITASNLSGSTSTTIGIAVYASAGATVSGTITLPAAVTDKVYAIVVDTDGNGDNGGFVAYTSGKVTGDSIAYSLTNVPAGSYKLYAVVFVVGNPGEGPVEGDYGHVSSDLVTTGTESHTVNQTLVVIGPAAGNSTVQGTVTLPAEVTDLPYVVIVDTDHDGGNGIVSATTGTVSGLSFEYAINDVPTGNYMVYAIVWIVGEVNQPPINGDYLSHEFTYVEVPDNTTVTVDRTLIERYETSTISGTVSVPAGLNGKSYLICLGMNGSVEDDNMKAFSSGTIPGSGEETSVSYEFNEVEQGEYYLFAIIYLNSGNLWQVPSTGDFLGFGWEGFTTSDVLDYSVPITTMTEYTGS